MSAQTPAKILDCVNGFAGGAEASSGMDAGGLYNYMSEAEFGGGDADFVCDKSSCDRGCHGTSAGVAGAYEEHYKIGEALNDALINYALSHDRELFSIDSHNGGSFAVTRWPAIEDCFDAPVAE